MRIALLQFNPELGKRTQNIARTNALLQAASPQEVDLLVLPELAFTGTISSPHPHPHPVLQNIVPFTDSLERLQLPLPFLHLAPP